MTETGGFVPKDAVQPPERVEPRVRLVDIEPKNPAHVERFADIEMALDPEAYEDVSSSREEAADYLTKKKIYTKIDELSFGPDDKPRETVIGIGADSKPDVPFADYILLDPAIKKDHDKYIKKHGIGVGDKQFRYELSYMNTSGLTPEEYGGAVRELLATMYTKALGKPFETGGVTDEDFDRMPIGIYAISGTEGEEAYQQALSLAGMKLHLASDGDKESPNTIWTVNPRDVLAAMQPPSGQPAS